MQTLDASLIPASKVARAPMMSPNVNHQPPFAPWEQFWAFPLTGRRGSNLLVSSRLRSRCHSARNASMPGEGLSSWYLAVECSRLCSGVAWQRPTDSALVSLCLSPAACNAARLPSSQTRLLTMRHNVATLLVDVRIAPAVPLRIPAFRASMCRRRHKRLDIGKFGG